MYLLLQGTYYYHWYIQYFLQFSFQIVITFYLNFLPLFNSAIKGACKFDNFALIFGFIYYYYIRSSYPNDMTAMGIRKNKRRQFYFDICCRKGQNFRQKFVISGSALTMQRCIINNRKNKH